MTISELYKWAVEHDVEDYDLMCCYADGGGYYSGSRAADYDITIDYDMREVTI